VPLPEQIAVRYSDEDAGYVSMRPVVKQRFRLTELIDMVVSVVGKEAKRVQQILRTGSVVYNGYRYQWDSLSADLQELEALLAPFPDDDPSLPFDAGQAIAALLEYGGGTQRHIVEIGRDEASEKKMFAKSSPWSLIVQLASNSPPRYEKYSHARHADLFRLTLPYDQAQQFLAELLELAPRGLRRRWTALRPPAAVTYVCPRKPAGSQ
jgi:hypothetical protein